MDYHFSYSDTGTYGHVVSLVSSLPLNGGIALDLGCGYGAVAEPLVEAGFHYVGVELDAASIADVAGRGFEAHELDLWGGPDGALTKSLLDIVEGRRVSVVLLLDVIEHCPAPARFLAELTAALDQLERPIIVVSIPNVAHVDVAGRLLAGEFTYTESGLLDRTHVQLWTETRVEAELGGLGWMPLAANDLRLRHSDQHDPNHPLLAEQTALGAWVRWVRTRCDDAGDVNQFVRAFALSPTAATSPPLPAPPATAELFLTVVMRTRGDRMTNLREALLCLAAQDDEDFEVVLVVHKPQGQATADVQRLVHEFSPDFADRVRVMEERNGGRTRPLNVGLDAARARYVAFLDDDDLVTADWVSTFHEGAEAQPGRIVRSLTVLRDVARDGQGPHAGYTLQSGYRSPYPPRFDYVQHLMANQTPIHSFAVPRALIDTLSIRFDESLPVTEDWDFLLRVSQLASVHDTEKVTSIYHWWVDRTGSAGAAPPEVWSAARQRVLGELAASPMLFGPESARQLMRWIDDTVACHARLAELEGAAAVAQARVDAFERSRVWAATGPVRFGLRRGRSVAGRVRSLLRSVTNP